MTILNVLAVGVAWVLMLMAQRRKDFATTVAAHACVVGWLVYCAFPLLGEGL